MPSGKRIELGRWGEEQAARHLVEKGLVILDRNVHTPHGEIDLVAKRDDVFVFVEVKTRSTLSYGYPEEAVTKTKQTHMIESAMYYLQRENQDKASWQIDVIAVQGKPGENLPEIVWYENAVS